MVNTEEQVSWNLSQKISEQIDSLLRMSRKYKLIGNVLDCFFVSKEIRLLINHHFSNKEKRKLNKIEKEIDNVSIQIKLLFLIDDDDFEYNEDEKEKQMKSKLIILRNRRIFLVELYRKIILKLLDTYGYLMERKKDATHMW